MHPVTKKIIPMAPYSRILHIPFEDAVNKITSNLKQHGFGIITSIDLQETFRQKLNLGFRKYRILGACNPQFAYKAISLESHLGVMLPCNVVVQEHENGSVEVSAVNPLSLGADFNSTQLEALAKEVGEHLRAALDELEIPATPGQPHALPMDGM
jgi:uncharacterized protein (DUF302 family)